MKEKLIFLGISPTQDSPEQWGTETRTTGGTHGICMLSDRTSAPSVGNLSGTGLSCNYTVIYMEEV